MAHQDKGQTTADGSAAKHPSFARRLPSSGSEWLVLGLSLLLCLFTFSGRLQSADELAVYALTYNLAQRGAVDVNVLASTAPGMTVPPFSGIGQFGLDGNFYSGKGILPSLLALPVLHAALLVPSADPVVAVLLLNGFLTALTACVIARHVRQQYGDAHASFIAGTLYTSGTMALAYSKRLFTEPAAALCVALAYYLVMKDWRLELGASSALSRLISTPHTSRLRLFLVGFALGGAMAASYSNAVLLPCFAFLVVIGGGVPLAWRSRAIRGASLALGLVPWAVGLALYNAMRFGDVTQNGLPLLAWSMPYFTPQAALVRMYGLLFSPYRGLLWYNPLLLLVPLAMYVTFKAPSYSRASRVALGMALSGTLLYVLFFSIWSMWWGGFNWGPRFLLPVMPLWVVAIAPLFCQDVYRRIPGLLKLGVGIIVALSVAVALVGGLTDTFKAEGELAQRGMLQPLVMPQSLTDSPLLVEWAYFQGVSGVAQFGRGELDVWWQARAPAVSAELAHAATDMAERTTPGSAVLLLAPRQVEPFLHAYRLSAPVYGLTPDQADIELLRQRMLSAHSRILLLTDAGQTDPNNTNERWLEQDAFRARNEFFGLWRVAAFGTPVTPTVTLSPLAQFGPSLRLLELEHSLTILPDGVVTIRARWQRSPGVALDGVAWYAHLLAPDGSLVSQHDALVGDAYGWGEQDIIDDRRGILVPRGTPPGHYRINIGTYGPGGPLPGQPASFGVQVVDK